MEVLVSTSANKTVVSLLHRLKSLTAADISRARKTKKNDPPRCKRHCRSALSSDPKGISPSQQVREFEKESFVVSNGHIFCSTCHEQLNLKRRLFSPHRVREMKPTASLLDQDLTCVPFLDADELGGLKAELPAYLAGVSDLHQEFDPLE